MIFAHNKFVLTGLKRCFGDNLTLGTHCLGSGKITVFDVAQDYNFKLPINWQGNSDCDPLYEQYLKFDATRPGRWLAEFDNALVLPPFNLVIFDSSTVFANSVRGKNFLKIYFNFQEHGVVSLKRDYSVKIVDEPVTVIGSSERRNYCHWITEVLPRYLFADGIVPQASKFAFFDFERPFQAECLKDFQHLNREHIFFDDLNSAYLCKKLYVPSLPSGSMWNFNRDLETYANFATSKIKMDSPGIPYRRILISRADASFRRIVNEDLLFNRLQAEYGFEKIILGNLSFQEQKQLFHESAVIISPHGAGMANLIFTQAQTKVIELMPKSHLNISDFWAIANYLKTIDYHILRSTQNDVDLGLGKQKTDFYVDVDRVLSLVADILSPAACGATADLMTSNN